MKGLNQIGLTRSAAVLLASCFGFASLPTFAQDTSATAAPVLRGPGLITPTPAVVDGNNQTTMTVSESAKEFAEAQKKLVITAEDFSQGATMCRIRLTVNNESDIPLTIDATKAELKKNGGATVAAESSGQMVPRKQKASKTAASFLTAAVSVGLIPTAQEIHEQKGDVLNRYEGDEKKRLLEEEMFGKTLLYPGNSNSGYIYFPTGADCQGAVLRCPVQTFYTPVSTAISELPIAKSK